MNTDLVFYGHLLGDIKGLIRQAQTRAALAVNSEMLRLYWDIGRTIQSRQEQEGWGAGVVPRLARDLRNELPELKGFSEANINRMLRFAREYPDLFPILSTPLTKLKSGDDPATISPLPVAKLETDEDAVAILSTPLVKLESGSDAAAIGPQAVAQLPADIKEQPVFAQIPWAHNVLLIQTVKDLPTRLWYAQQVITQGWSHNTLSVMIKSRAYDRQGAAVTNFAARLPAPQSDLASQLLKDPYLFDFLTLEEPFHERELETGLVRHLEKFLIELGQGFAFVGRQYRLEVSDKEFFLDLLFYHLNLRCFVVAELKKGEFKPEYAGKMNFYCSVVDDKLKHATDQPTIGLILCQTKDRILAEYALRDIHKPIGVADYELTRALPKELASSLPTIEQIEAELQSELTGED